MQLRFRRKRVWAAALFVGLFLALVVFDVLDQGLFPERFPLALRALGFIVPVIALWLLIDIFRDTSRQVWLATLGLTATLFVYAVGVFRAPLRPGDTILDPLLAAVILSLPDLLGWGFVVWALKSSQFDFAEQSRD
ncbi:hypothetical protein [uncultured Litoreibacter sp.]|uniref:hypothetical protein n=1 Tax=uncultured Litoreibacter sp. TaxID=1392394 RepID=UPI002617DEDA|nr:hypothetical protein [uncultured Litoreibacter sp.]